MILELARSIGEGFVDMGIGDVQNVFVGQAVGEAGLVEIASQPQLNEIDSNSDEENYVNNFKLKNYRKD